MDLNHDDLQKSASALCDPQGQGRPSLESAPSAQSKAASLAHVPEVLRLVEAWMRKVNDRWLVHSGLNFDTQAYLDHLAATDAARLRRTCAIVQQLMTLHDPLEDPKPPFYGGTFSLASKVEETIYLTGHRFTRLLLPSTSEETLALEAEDLELAPEVRKRIGEIRGQICEAVALLREIGSS
ncbi:MAG TPA: hypothetical protein VK956_08405 [Verrucomicrobium sp.]|nr:hypothetical protein [Verrucomicrobium sp.]